MNIYVLLLYPVLSENESLFSSVLMHTSFPFCTITLVSSYQVQCSYCSLVLYGLNWSAISLKRAKAKKKSGRPPQCKNQPISPTPSPYSSPLLSPSLSTLTQPCPVIVVYNFSLLPPLLVSLSFFIYTCTQSYRSLLACCPCSTT